MSERKTPWTPGPWHINKYGSIGSGKFGTDPIIARIEPFYGRDEQFGNHTNNARLIAEAPAMAELLAHCQEILDVWRNDIGEDGREVADNVRALLARIGAAP